MWGCFLAIFFAPVGARNGIYRFPDYFQLTVVFGCFGRCRRLLSAERTVDFNLGYHGGSKIHSLLHTEAISHRNTVVFGSVCQLSCATSRYG